jgi:chromosome segregation ATPase
MYMRWTIAAFMAGALLVTGCQDSEARKQIEELRAENAKLKDKPDAFTQLMAMRAAEGGNDGTDRKINTLSEDLRAGIAALKSEFSATNKRVDDMDDRMRKVASLDATITALKATIDSLDSRVKNSSPEEMLKFQKDLFQKEAALNQEKLAREAADAKVTQLQAELKSALEAAQELRDQIASADSSDISKHPAYLKLQKELRDEKIRAEQAKGDIDSLDAQVQRLQQEVNRLGGKTAAAPAIDTKAYDFTGTVIQFDVSTQTGTLGNIMVRVESGQVPPKGSILSVLNARAERICNATKSVDWHFEDDATKAVEAIGCAVNEEKAVRVPTVGDTVVWVKPAEDKGDKPAEDRTGKPTESSRSGGGD